MISIAWEVEPFGQGELSNIATGRPIHIGACRRGDRLFN